MKVAYWRRAASPPLGEGARYLTQALAPKQTRADELESVTCCGAGDIHEAEPDYYLHLNADPRHGGRPARTR
jgi:hypothetical protein